MQYIQLIITLCLSVSLKAQSKEDLEVTKLKNYYLSHSVSGNKDFFYDKKDKALFIGKYEIYLSDAVFSAENKFLSSPVPDGVVTVFCTDAPENCILNTADHTWKYLFTIKFKTNEEREKFIKLANELKQLIKSPAEIKSS